MAISIVLIGVIVSAGWASGSHRVREIASDLSGYFLHRENTLSLDDDTDFLRQRDPVFVADDSGNPSLAGFVRSIEQETPARRVTILWFDPSTSPEQYEFSSHQNRGSIDDIVAMMFPPEKRARIERLVADAMRDHGDRLVAQLMPVMERSMRESLPVIEAGFRDSIERHRDEIDLIVGRWNDEILTQRLLPMAKSEIVPIVMRNSQPVAEVIGRELWDRASMWSFTWRAIYDKTPLPRRDLMKQEWDRFVAEDAIPVLDEHSGEIAAAIQKSMAEIAENQNVRREIATAATTIATDPSARALIKVILKESIAENVALRRVWADAWTSPEAQAAIADAGQALEPTIRRIGDELMGTRENGIDPGFAKLLRNQVLEKDKRWITATPLPSGTSSSGRIEFRESRK